MSDNKFYDTWFNGKYPAKAWCPDCRMHGVPFMYRNDRECGNCGKKNLEYFISEQALKDCVAEFARELRQAAYDAFFHCTITYKAAFPIDQDIDSRFENYWNNVRKP